MRTILALLALVGVAVSLPALAAVRGEEAMYVGGTVANTPEKTAGHLDLSGESALLFAAKKGNFRIPYKGIISLEYGQKVGRRVGAALAISPVLLLSKKRKHFLSVTFIDEQNAKQGAVFEIAKGAVRGVATTLELRSGRKIEFESKEAREHFERESRQ